MRRLVAGTGEAKHVLILARLIPILLAAAIESKHLSGHRPRLPQLSRIVLFYIIVQVLNVVVDRCALRIARLSRQLVQHLAKSLALAQLGRRTVVVRYERMVVVVVAVATFFVSLIARLDRSLCHSH